MINLLPPELKQSYHYGRYNYRLARWVGVFVAGIAGIAVITFGGIFYMNRSIDSYTKQVASNNAHLASQGFTTTQKQVQDISNNLKLMVQVLSKEVLFSKLLAQLGSVTPSNVILTNLAISQTEGAINITAQTADYNAATQLQINLADPKNQIFSKADIVSITCAVGAANPKYPCTAVLRALFSENNPFLFISNSNTTKAKP